MSQGIERNKLTSRSLEDNVQSLMEQGRSPFFIDALEHRARFLGRFLLFQTGPRKIVRCIVPPEEAVSGEWSHGKCEFFSKDGASLGNGALVILNPKRAAKLMNQIEAFKAANSKTTQASPTPTQNI